MGAGGKMAGKAGASSGAGGAQAPSGTTPDAGLPKKDASTIEDSGSKAVCNVDEETVLYLSADDSNSVASPVIVRKAIVEGKEIDASYIRTYEFTNYYDFKYETPERGSLNVVPQMRREQSADPGGYVMQIGVQSHLETLDKTKPLALTFVVDSSGSMAGTPLELEKEVLTAIAASLREGDVVSMTTWNTESKVAIDSHAVTGPNDKTFLEAIAGLTADGSTDLNKGLITGYRLAKNNFFRHKLNRVILISDGQANVGNTDEQLIAEHADDSEDEAIYLVGVGCGVGFNDTLMDTVTDAGKGAYLFIDTKEEARKQFSGDRFVSNLAIAAMDVRVKMTLPRSFSMKEFHGEQYSADPRKVEPQHLAPNDAMVFHQTIQSCAPDLLTGKEYVTAEAFFTDPATRERKSVMARATLNELLAQTHPQLLKGDAVVEYAEMFKKLPALQSSAARKEKCLSVQSIVRSANQGSNDPDLVEIDQLLTTYCARF
jgi:Ca-activated chloride channel family protein